MGDLLWVDNDRRLAELLARWLQGRGHTVRIAGSFAEARQLLAERRPDLLLSDLDLGAERGGDEILRLAADGALPPTLVVSGFLDAEMDARLRRVPGVCGTLAKPFEVERLDEHVAAALAAASSRVVAETAGAGAVDVPRAPGGGDGPEPAAHEVSTGGSAPMPAAPGRPAEDPIGTPGEDGWIEIVPFDPLPDDSGSATRHEAGR